MEATRVDPRTRYFSCGTKKEFDRALADFRRLVPEYEHVKVVYVTQDGGEGDWLFRFDGSVGAGHAFLGFIAAREECEVIEITDPITQAFVVCMFGDVVLKEKKYD